MISLLLLHSCHSGGSRPDPALSRALIIPILQIKKPRLGRHKTASLFSGMAVAGLYCQETLQTMLTEEKKKYIKDCWLCLSTTSRLLCLSLSWWNIVTLS